MTGWHSATTIPRMILNSLPSARQRREGRICREASDLVAMTANLLRYWFAADSSVEGGGFELPVPRAMQARLKAKIAGFGCMPPSIICGCRRWPSAKAQSEISEPNRYRARNRKFESVSLQR
jgi:hypothetical protein